MNTKSKLLEVLQQEYENARAGVGNKLLDAIEAQPEKMSVEDQQRLRERLLQIANSDLSKFEGIVVAAAERTMIDDKEQIKNTLIGEGSCAVLEALTELLVVENTMASTKLRLDSFDGTDNCQCPGCTARRQRQAAERLNPSLNIEKLIADLSGVGVVVINSEEDFHKVLGIKPGEEVPPKTH